MIVMKCSSNRILLANVQAYILYVMCVKLVVKLNDEMHKDPGT